MQVIDKRSLPTVRMDGEVMARIFEGGRHGDVTVSAFVVEVSVGKGPRRHHHPYEEVFIIMDGAVRLEAGGETLVAGPDDICVVPAGVPHAFAAVGDGPARMVNIHATAYVVTEFVEEEPADGTYEYNRD